MACLCEQTNTCSISDEGIRVANMEENSFDDDDDYDYNNNTTTTNNNNNNNTKILPFL